MAFFILLMGTISNGQHLSGEKAAASEVKVYCYRSESLAKAKAEIKAKNQKYSIDLERLRKQADKALQSGPYSVMDKSRMPLSGNRHDYLSLAPYYWPDPSKKDGLPYIDRDGEVNPESEIGTDSRALGRMSSDVNTLAMAYYFTENESYAQHAALLLRTWFLDPGTRMNPHLEYAQGMPGRNSGQPYGIIDTQVLIKLVDAVGLLEGCKAWTVKDLEGMESWVEAFTHWLRTSKHGIQESEADNNHGTWYFAQIASFSLFVGKKEQAQKILEGIKQRIARQIEPDGRQQLELKRTKSFSYSIFNLSALFDLAEMGQKIGVDLYGYQTKDGRSIKKALDYLAPYMDPERIWPYIDINPRGRDRNTLAYLLHIGALTYKDKVYDDLLSKFGRDVVPAHRLQLLFPQ
jgi:hypothetical protein